MKIRVKMICCFDIPDEEWEPLMATSFVTALETGLRHRGFTPTRDHETVKPYRELKQINCDPKLAVEFQDGEDD